MIISLRYKEDEIMEKKEIPERLAIFVLRKCHATENH